jgi:hypothetical protein
VLELWTVDAAACLSDDPHLPASTLTVQDDSITCVTPLEQQPYLMLGCASGAVRVAVLVNASGAPVMEARQARSLKLMPYLGEQLGQQAPCHVYNMYSIWQVR